MRKRIISCLLVQLLCLGFIPSVSAAGIGVTSEATNVVVDPSLASAWDSFFDAKIEFLSDIFPGVLAKVIKSDLLGALDDIVSKTGYGQFPSHSALSGRLGTINGLLKPGEIVLPQAGIVPYSGRDALRLALGGVSGNFSFSTVQHATYGWVIQENNSGLILCNSAGQFPYYKPATVTDPDTGAETEDTALGGKWVRMDKVSWTMTNVINEATLYDMGWALRAADQDTVILIPAVSAAPMRMLTV